MKMKKNYKLYYITCSIYPYFIIKYNMLYSIFIFNVSIRIFILLIQLHKILKYEKK